MVLNVIILYFYSLLSLSLTVGQPVANKIIIVAPSSLVKVRVRSIH